MNRRNALSLFAGVAISSVSPDCPSSAQGVTEDEQVKWVGKALERMEHVKPGMKRVELLSVFTTEGGLSTGLQRTYVSRDCRYFKVDVTFRAVGRPGSGGDGRVTLAEDPRDEIVSMSRPYLEFSILD